MRDSNRHPLRLIATGNEKYLDMHRKANEWMYAHLPDAEYPEWYGYLHRDGSVAQPAKGNIFIRVRSTYTAHARPEASKPATRYSPCKRSHAPPPREPQYRFILPAMTTITSYRVSRPEYSLATKCTFSLTEMERLMQYIWQHCPWMPADMKLPTGAE